MRQLSPLDAQFLNAETSTTLVHVGSLTIVDPAGSPRGDLTVEDLRELIGGRLHLIGPLRWQLHEVPLGLDLPYWVESDEFDLEYHIREIALVAPGTDEQLGEQVARLAARPLDRSRPLWECYLIHGLENGRKALYTKVHHSAIDGVSGAEVLAVIMDATPEPREVEPPDPDAEPDEAPGTARAVLRGVWKVAARPARFLLNAPTMLPHVLDLPGAQTIPGVPQVAKVVGTVTRMAGLSVVGDRPDPAPVPPRTPFNGPITPHRRFAFTSLPLEGVKEVKNAFGLTVNDVVMALCTTVLRTWLVEHDALPRSPLVAAIPVSVRTPEQMGTAGNQIAFMLTALPTHEHDPAQRLEDLHTSLLEAKERFDAVPAQLLQEYSSVLPQALHGLASRTLLRALTMGAPPFNLFISNVPGPQLPLYTAGSRVTGSFPVSAVSDAGGGINITVMSYDGHLDFGIIVCREMVPDVWDMARGLHDAMDELLEMARQQSPGGRRKAPSTGR
jgi:diacylglycerol O-acyltransferase